MQEPLTAGVAAPEALAGEFVTGAEVARRYRVHRETVRRWRRRGTFPGALKVGRQWLFRAAEVRERLEGGAR